MTRSAIQLLQYGFPLSLQVVSDDALVHWLDQYNSSADTCTHAYWLVLLVASLISLPVIKMFSILGGEGAEFPCL